MSCKLSMSSPSAVSGSTTYTGPILMATQASQQLIWVILWRLP